MKSSSATGWSFCATTLRNGTFTHLTQRNFALLCMNHMKINNVRKVVNLGSTFDDIDNILDVVREK